MRVCFLLAAVLAGTAAHAAPPPGDVAAGKAAYRACARCHEVGPSARSGFGPQLNGIVGRRAGADPDYRYSDAMRQSSIVWTEATLAAFIRKPDAVVPGNSMRFLAIGYNDQKIANLLAYLRSVPAAP